MDKEDMTYVVEYYRATKRIEILTFMMDNTDGPTGYFAK